MQYIRTENGVEKFTDEEAEAYLNAQKPAETYADKRRREYGNIGDQLDEIYHDIDAWRARIASIKEKYPKS